MGGAGLRSSSFAVLPVSGIDDFLQARFKDSIEIFALFNEDIFSLAGVLTIEIDYSMAGGTRTSEIIQHN